MSGSELLQMQDHTWECRVNESDRQRIIEFMERKMCGPCRRADLNPSHDGCVEAATLIEILNDDQP
jgi:hypothetical protein